MVNLKRFLFGSLLLSMTAAALTTLVTVAAESQTVAPLRVYIRSGPKSHGPGAHDYPRYLKDWVPLLNERGAQATGAETFPTKAQLDETDVVILHKQEAGNIEEADRKNLNEYLARGGGLVVIHAGTVSRDPDWFTRDRRRLMAQRDDEMARRPDAALLHRPGQSDYQRRVQLGDGRRDLLRHGHPAGGADPRGGIHAHSQPARATPTSSAGRTSSLAAARKSSIYDIQPQMWTYERTVEGSRVPYRAFVSIPGHLYENFNRSNYRTILLRGIAWAGKRANVDELVKKDELGDALRYPEGGPTAPAKAAAKIEVHPEFDLIARGGRAAHCQGDEHRLGREGPAVGLGDARVSERPARAERGALAGYGFAPASPSGTRSRGHHLDSVRHERRRRDGSQARVRRQARARDRFCLLQVRRHRGDVAGHLVSRGHQRRRGRRQANQAVHGPRHVRHARRHQQPSLGSRRLDLRHARIQCRRGHLTRRDEEFRPRRQRRRALPARRQRVRAVQQSRRQHLGARHYLGRPGVLDAADERHGPLPHGASPSRYSRRPRFRRPTRGRA